MNKVNLIAISWAIILGIFIPLQTIAQKKGQSNSSRNDQWWIGFKGGINSTSMSVDQQYTVFSSANTLDPDDLDKSYENITKYGTQAGVIIAYEFIDDWSISLQPSAVTYQFGYTNEYSWVDFNNTSNTLDLTLKHDHTLRYFEVPLFIRYDFSKIGSGGIGKSKPSNKYVSQNNALIPYVHIGAFYGRLLAATKSVDITGVDVASGGTSELESINQTVDIDDQLININTGLIGGIGISYYIGNARLKIEGNYKYGLNNITNVKNRYTAVDLVTGSYDVLDDMKIGNIEILVGILMPLKFITSQKYNVL